VFALPIGAILDAYGPRLTSIIGCVLLALGSLIFSFGSSFPFDGYLTGFLLLAIGGPFIYIASFHLSNTFPKHSGLILSALTGAFDCSSALFLLFRLVHLRLGGLLSLKVLFRFYLLVPAVILVCQIFVMPARSYQTVRELLQRAQDASADRENRAEGNGSHPEGEVQRDRIILSKIYHHLQGGTGDLENIDGSRSLEMLNGQQETWGAMHMASARQQIRSRWFIFMTVFTVLQMLRLNYFISTISLQYEYLLHSRKLAAQLNHVFDILLPVGGIVATPFVGTFLDHARMSTVLSTMVLTATAIGILGCIPGSLFTAYSNISLFVLFRPLFYTVISDYAAKVFGFQTFGKVVGLIVCLAGIGNLLQTPLDILTFEAFGQDPIPVNVILTLTAFVAGCLLVTFVFRKTRRQGRCSRADATRDESQMPAANREGDSGDRDDDLQETDRLLPTHADDASADRSTYGAANSHTPD
jgi:MFS family permease